MNILIQAVGIIITIAYMGIALILTDSKQIDSNKLCFYFSTLAIYLPFAIYGFFRKKTENYIKITTIFFSSIASLISATTFFLLDLVITYKVFWSIQIVIWAVVVLLILFSVIAIKGVRG